MQTINTINNYSDQTKLYNTFKDNRQAYYDTLVTRSVNNYKKKHPKATESEIKQNTNLKWKNGWTNRVNSFNDKTAVNPTDVNCDD